MYNKLDGYFIKYTFSHLSCTILCEVDFIISFKMAAKLDDLPMVIEKINNIAQKVPWSSDVKSPLP